MCITSFFHPQDLLAMGLILLGISAFLKKRWVGAGVLMALAVCTQQFALLVAVPLFVIARSRAKVSYVLAFIGISSLIDVPLIVASSGRGFRTVLLGSSRVGSSIRSFGGTVLWEADLKGPLLFTVSRLMPIIAAGALAWWTSRQLAGRLLEPSPLMSLLASALAFRLVFEENLFGYYFMATAVALVLLDVVCGHIRATTISWLVIVSLAFSPIYIGFSDTENYGPVPFVVITIAFVSLLLYAVMRRFPPYKTIWFSITAALCEYRIWGVSHAVFAIPEWCWQIVLAPTALALACSPLVSLIRGSGRDKGDPSLIQVLH
jgi:hypothetical protein